MKYFLTILIASIFSSAHGNIAWEKQGLSQKGKLFEEEPILYRYLAINHGGPRKISSVRPSCPCIQIIDYPKDIIQTGENFEILAVLSPSELGGNQRYYLNVSYNLSGVKPDRLILKCDMPSLITFSANHLYWSKAGEAVKQSITLKLHNEHHLELVESYVMDENFTSVREKIDEKKIVISVVPRDMAVTRPASLMLKFRSKGKDLQKLIPLIVADRNPFSLNLHHLKVNRPKPMDFKKLEQSLHHQNSKNRSRDMQNMMPLKSPLNKKDESSKSDAR